MRLQLAVKILASGNGQRNVRMDEATSALTGLIPEYFPAALRERAKRVLSVRERIRRERGSNLVSFRFDLLETKRIRGVNVAVPKEMARNLQNFGSG